MEKLISSIEKTLTKRINILFIDDDEKFLEMIVDLLDAPCFNIVTAQNYREATRILDNNKIRWHCVVIDHYLGPEYTGLDIIKRYPKIKATIFFSGAANCEDSVSAFCHGATVVSKGGIKSITHLVDEIYKKVVINYFINGLVVKELDIFKMLYENDIYSLEDWAKKIGNTTRHLSRLCQVHTNISSKKVLLLLKGMSFYLYHYQYLSIKLMLHERQWSPPRSFMERSFIELYRYCTTKFRYCACNN
jgi:response regulator RpfG family c-di-GMP phosphodiesterase